MKHARILTLLFLCLFAAAAAGCFKPPRDMPNESVIGYDGKKNRWITSMAAVCAPIVVNYK